MQNTTAALKNSCKLVPSIIQSGYLNSVRSISTTPAVNGKRNFRKFVVPNKRGSRLYKESQKTSARELPIDNRGVRKTGILINGRYREIPELIPELIVPDLTDCKLKPYVSYKTPNIQQSEFTSEDLFNTVYAPKIMEDFKAGKLDSEGNPLDPTAEERRTPEEARLLARKTGSDMF